MAMSCASGAKEVKLISNKRVDILPRLKPWEYVKLLDPVEESQGRTAYTVEFEDGLFCDVMCIEEGRYAHIMCNANGSELYDSKAGTNYGNVENGLAVIDAVSRKHFGIS